MNARMLRGVCFTCAFFCSLAPVSAQKSAVSPRNMYDRVIAITPIVGAGTYADPKRPMYAPLASQFNPMARKGKLSNLYHISDDDRYALLELVELDSEQIKSLHAT